MEFEQVVDLYGEFALNALMVFVAWARLPAEMERSAADRVFVLVVRECVDTAVAASNVDPRLE